MTKEENLKWLDVEIRTWESECQSKHPIKEALYVARKALEQEPILEKDGTLIVTTEHCENVGRVLVQYGTNGALFYQDQDSTTKNDIRDNRVKNELNRVKDELEPTTKNDLGDDCVRRKAVLNTLERMDKVLDEDRTVDSYKELLKECYKVLPSVAPQESILDKIRAEIEQNAYSIVHGVNNHEKGMTLYGVLQIIDKYKAESEVSE